MLRKVTLVHDTGVPYDRGHDALRGRSGALWGLGRMSARARRWLALIAVLWVPVVFAHKPQPALFGIPLISATRPVLKRALTAAHMTLRPGGTHRWYDVYNVNGALKHASTLAVSFTKQGRFAKAEYVFPSFISTKRMSEVLAMVRAKYGPPTKMVGRLNIGPVRAWWKLAHAFEIIVKRRWPNPTTFMVIENRRLFLRMKAEQKQATAHSGAF
ncbi:MAG: hypothetical protein ACYDEV_13885 [Acidiferrobacter sp.]